MTARKPRNRTKAASKAAKTIDLTAEDVTEKPTPDNPTEVADKVSPENTAPDAPAEVSDETPASEAPEMEKSEPKDAATDASVDEKADAILEKDAIEDKAEKVDEPAPAAPEAAKVTTAPATTPKQGGFGSGLIGGLLGGVAVVAVCYYALQQGILPLPTTDAQKQATAQLQTVSGDLESLKAAVAEKADVDLAPLDERIAALEAQIGKVSETLSLATASAPAEGEATEGEAAPRVDLAPINYALAGLTSKLEEVTSQAASLTDSQGGLTQRIAGLEGLHAQFVEAKKQISELEVVTKAQAARIEEKAAETIAKLESEIGSAKEAILSNTDRRLNDVVVDMSKFGDKVTADATDLLGRVTSLEENNVSEKMQSSARTIALAGLENAVASGANYQLALVTFSDVVGANPALDILNGYAESGAPTKTNLSADFAAVYDSVLKEAEDAGAGTLLDKFLLNAQNLVKVRSLSGEKKGKSLTNLLGVIEFHVKKGDLVKAAAEWDALPDAAREAKSGAGWVEGMKARIAVDAAMETIRAEFGDLAKKNAS